METRRWAVLTLIIWVSNTADQWVRATAIAAAAAPRGTCCGARRQSLARRSFLPARPPAAKTLRKQKNRRGKLPNQPQPGASISALRWDIYPLERLSCDKSGGSELECVRFLCIRNPFTCRHPLKTSVYSEHLGLWGSKSVYLPKKCDFCDFIARVSVKKNIAATPDKQLSRQCLTHRQLIITPTSERRFGSLVLSLRYAAYGAAAEKMCCHGSSL